MTNWVRKSLNGDTLFARKFTPEGEANIRELYKGGMSVNFIAKRLKVSDKTISRICAEAMTPERSKERQMTGLKRFHGARRPAYATPLGFDDDEMIF
jgi:DNA invertase Pin-like site-specific DNA recombinase